MPPRRAAKTPSAKAAIEGARPESAARPYSILAVDDEAGVVESLRFTLEDAYRVVTFTDPAAALKALAREDFALVIVDNIMPGMSGVEFLKRAVEIRPQAVRMMLTGQANAQEIIGAINAGRIYRYIAKPWEPEDLRLDVKRALEAYGLASENAQLAGALAAANEKLRAENTYLRREVEGQYGFENIIGQSPAMQRVFGLMAPVAQTDASVLLTGETGTGKDLVARALHYRGPRSRARFVAQNCGALPDTLLESELFGHKKGAFTGAHADKKGLFELAHGGTIFLDEIGETEAAMQVRLLRVLQDGEIRPLGAADIRRVDVRVIAATNRDLKQAVADGDFREDLYYRLHVVEINLPPLRERREDIPALAHHFLDRACEKMKRNLKGFTNAAMAKLTAHEWSGNVRELQNEIERAVALSGDATTVRPEMFSDAVGGGTSAAEFSAAAAGATSAAVGGTFTQTVDALKRRLISEALAAADSKTEAAARLGVTRQSMQKMIKRLGLPE